MGAAGAERAPAAGYGGYGAGYGASYGAGGYGYDASGYGAYGGYGYDPYGASYVGGYAAGGYGAPPPVPRSERGRPGLQAGQTVRPGDWRCTSCSNVK